MVSAPKPRPSRIFVDSSVLIAAAISEKGSARNLLLRGMRGDVQLFISPLVLEETHRNVTRKAPTALPAFLLLQQVLGAKLIDPSPQLISNVAKSVEWKDAPIVAAAVAAEVDFLATYDQKHLLRQKELIRTTFGLVVAAPDEILAATSNP